MDGAGDTFRDAAPLAEHPFPANFGRLFHGSAFFSRKIHFDCQVFDLSVVYL
jgi:hypothetical protein